MQEPPFPPETISVRQINGPEIAFETESIDSALPAAYEVTIFPNSEASPETATLVRVSYTGTIPDTSEIVQRAPDMVLPDSDIEQIAFSAVANYVVSNENRE